MNTPVPASVFLTAEWQHLVMLNYEIEPEILKPRLPTGTELDFWNGKTFVSVVGFNFQNTRIRGIPIPFHRNFEEVNLRFYVRRKTADGWRRGVVFIKELVPRLAIAWTAQTFYNEPYLALPMSHRIEKSSSQPFEIKSATYFWRFKGNDNSVKLNTHGNLRPLVENSEAEFITEHYWGYTSQRDGSTLEYQVEHPRWRIWEAQSVELHCDIAELYGEQFVSALNITPVSAFLAEGSAVKVYKGVRL
ncbi:MAG: DUF2071 domain-containing protein [Verrucomicrobiae bacterium]